MLLLLTTYDCAGDGRVKKKCNEGGLGEGKRRKSEGGCKIVG
jgi:hypothetical protein